MGNSEMERFQGHWLSQRIVLALAPTLYFGGEQAICYTEFSIIDYTNFMLILIFVTEMSFNKPYEFQLTSNPPVFR